MRRVFLFSSLWGSRKHIRLPPQTGQLEASLVSRIFEGEERDPGYEANLPLRGTHILLFEESHKKSGLQKGPFTYYLSAVPAGSPEWGRMDCSLVSVGWWRGLQEEGEGSRPHPPGPTHHHRPASRPRGCPSPGPIPTPSLTPTTPSWGSG